MSNRGYPAKKTLNQAYSSSEYLKFMIPSLLGIFLFVIPIPAGETITVPIAYLAGIINSSLAPVLPAIMTILISLSFLGSLLAKTIRPAFISNSPFLEQLFNVSTIWVFLRLLGTIFAIMTLFEIGPAWVYSENTGGLLFYSLIPMLFSLFLLAGLFLPLLLDFGLLEIFGTLLTKLMRPVFTLPGRASMDCLASWLGDGTVGVLLTNKQYEDGYYTKREAAVIGTTFSVVSITFTDFPNEKAHAGRSSSLDVG